MNIMAASGATPRKFAEKIAMHNQKGAEEEAEFLKIMSECAAVKGNAVGGTIQKTPQQQQQHPQQQRMSAMQSRGGDIPTVLGTSPSATDSGLYMTGHMAQNASGHKNLGPPHMMGGGQQGSNGTGNGHNSLRDSKVGPAGGSATQIHTLRTSSQAGSSGPIRTKHRKDTSPYGSDRLSIGSSNATVTGSSSHLSPPDTSMAWRRVRSDPFIHSSVSSGGSSTGVSPAGSVSDTPTAVQQGSNGAISPLHGASPTMHRRVPYNNGPPSHHVHAAENVQNVKNNYQLGIPIPETSSGGELKPGSLPNLTNLEIGQSPGSQSGGIIVNHACNLANNSSGGTSTIVKDEQESPYSSSMSGTSGGSFVRLSDTEISKILSIPMSLVSESSQQDEQAKNVNVSSASLCDNSSNQRNLLHLSKGVAVEQQTCHQTFVYGHNQLDTSRIKSEDPSQNPGDLSSMSNYRNPQSIQPPPSPVMHGSPMGRSSSPIDMIGSPHSPATGNGSCPQYPDAMALAGQNYQHFMDLTKDVQKLSVLETPPASEQRMYIPTTSGYNRQQPINEFVDFFNNQQQIDAKNSINQFSNQQISSPNPQTPSSIPDIILTAEDGSDQALQRMLGLSNDFDCFSTEDFKEGLGKLDDNMFRLLSDNGAMDQLADPATEEHLKKV